MKSINNGFIKNGVILNLKNGDIVKTIRKCLCDSCDYFINTKCKKPEELEDINCSDSNIVFRKQKGDIKK